MDRDSWNSVASEPDGWNDLLNGLQGVRSRVAEEIMREDERWIGESLETSNKPFSSETAIREGPDKDDERQLEQRLRGWLMEREMTRMEQDSDDTESSDDADGTSRSRRQHIPGASPAGRRWHPTPKQRARLRLANNPVFNTEAEIPRSGALALPAKPEMTPAKRGPRRPLFTEASPSEFDKPGWKDSIDSLEGDKEGPRSCQPPPSWDHRWSPERESTLGGASPQLNGVQGANAAIGIGLLLYGAVKESLQTERKKASQRDAVMGGKEKKAGGGVPRREMVLHAVLLLMGFALVTVVMEAALGLERMIPAAWHRLLSAFETNESAYRRGYEAALAFESHLRSVIREELSRHCSNSQAIQ